MSQLIRTIYTDFLYSAPDPAGLAFVGDDLFISDSEVEETGLWSGYNLFGLTESAVTYGSVFGYSGEPTGLSFNSTQNHLYVSDDKTRRIYTVDAGYDGAFGTADDVLINEINTRSFGSRDPEGVAYHEDLGTLWVADGKTSRINQIDTEGNLISSFETARLGLIDPEGIDVNPVSGNLFLVGQPSNEVFEVTVEGALVQRLSIAEAEALKPAGLTLAPDLNSFFVADRGIDNSEDPLENDGKLYEIELGHTLYATSRETVHLNGFTFEDEDVIAYDARAGEWGQYLDGSDVGLGEADIDALHVNGDGSVLLSLNKAQRFDGLGRVDDSDILRFTPTSVGDHSAGEFELYFDGSDVGLSQNAEDIDAIALLDGDILLSTNGAYSVGGLNGADEDVLLFNAERLGHTTAGTWSRYLDGSTVGLGETSAEDVKGISSFNEEVVISTLGEFEASGISGAGSDLISIDEAGESSLFSEGLVNGFNGQLIADFSVA